MAPKVIVGNAALEGAERRGWFMGHFMATADARGTDVLEVKWGVHPVGEGRSQWGSNAEATTLSILIEGRFRLEFPDQTVVLSQPGDYALWLPGVTHTWHAEMNCTILTVRYPSVASG